jgi:quinol monooxygenase YgiN
MATEITAGTSCLTLVNVFETTSETQHQLIDILAKATKEEMSKQPGFISANFHASRDGLRVVNYAQWESVEALEAMTANPACQVHMREAEALVTIKPDVHYYDVRSTFGAPEAVSA